MLNDVLHDDFNLFILLHLLIVLHHVGRSIPCRPLVMLTLFHLRTCLVSFEDLYQVEVVGSACIPIDNDEAILLAHVQHEIKELHIGLLIEIFPIPFVLVKDLRSVRL